MGVHAAQGTQIRLRIRAQDILIARHRPDDISALNILPAQIETIRKGDGPGVALRLIAGQTQLLARITARALYRMALKEGDTVFAVIKASSVAPGSISGAFS